MSVEGIPLVNPDLYAETYYDEPAKENGTRTEVYGRVEDTISPFHRAIFVFLLRAGLLLIQLGSIPIKDTNTILLHNVFEFSVASVSYGIVGYIFAYGKDAGQLIGYGHWISSYDANMDDAISGWSAIITATGLFTTMVAGRIHLLGYVVVVVVMTAFVDPLMIHWIWTPEGFMHNYELRGEPVSYRDMGGCAIVHMFAGTVALVAIFALGRRLMRLRDIDESSIPPSAPATCFLGYFLLIIGLLALCMPNMFYEDNHVPDNYVGRILMNNIMAMAGGMLVVCLIQFAMDRDTFNYWTMLRCMQGAVAGMVVISAGADCYTPVVALLLGMGAGTIYYFVARALFNSPTEDYCNIIPIHFLCGLIGTLMPPMFGDTPGFAFDKNAPLRVVVLNVCWQVICDGILLVIFFAILIPLFLLLYCLGFIHNRSDEVDHRRAQTVLDRGPDRSLMQRLFKPGDPPRLIVPGNESKDEARQRLLLDATSRVNISYFSPRSLGNPSYNEMGSRPERNLPVQTYRAEVVTSRPPLADYYNVDKEDGEYLFGDSPAMGFREGEKDTDTKISIDGRSDSGRIIEYNNIQNVPYGEPAGLPSSKYNVASNELVRSGGDNVNLEYDSWQMNSQHKGTVSSEGNLNLPRQRDQEIILNGQTFSYHERMLVGSKSEDGQSGQTHHDDKTLRCQYMAGINVSQSAQNVPFENTLKLEYRDRSEELLNLSNTSDNVVSECIIQIDDETEFGGNVASEDRFQTVYMRGAVDTGSTEDILDSGCISAQYRSVYVETDNDTSVDNLRDVYALANDTSDNRMNLTESGRFLMEHRNKRVEPQRIPFRGNAQGDYRFGPRASPTSNDYVPYKSGPDYSQSDQTFRTSSSEPNEKKNDTIRDVDGNIVKPPETVSCGSVSCGQFEAHESSYVEQIPNSEFSLRYSSDGGLTDPEVNLVSEDSSAYVFTFREKEDPCDKEEEVPGNALSPRGVNTDSAVRSTISPRGISLSLVAQALGSKRGLLSSNQTAKRAGKKRDKRDVLFSLRARSASLSATKEAEVAFESEEFINHSDSTHSEGSDSNILVGVGGNETPIALSRREESERARKKTFLRVVDELCTRFSKNSDRGQLGTRPSSGFSISPDRGQLGPRPSPELSTRFSKSPERRQLGTRPSPELSTRFSKSPERRQLGTRPSPELSTRFSKSPDRHQLGTRPSPELSTRFSTSPDRGQLGTRPLPELSTRFSKSPERGQLGTRPSPELSTRFSTSPERGQLGTRPSPELSTRFSQSPERRQVGTRLSPDLSTRFAKSDDRRQLVARPSPSRPCFSHNQLALRQQQQLTYSEGQPSTGEDVIRDVMFSATLGQAKDACATVNPIRLERDENSDLLIRVDPDEEAIQEDHFNNLNKWFD